MADKSLAEKMTSIPKSWLYLLLFLCASLPLLVTVVTPDVPDPASVDLYAGIMNLPNGSTVLLGSDWTNSTRAESGGQMEALLRILMRKDIKFVLYSIGDPQSVEVATKSIEKINEERKAAGQREYVGFQDWVSAGFLANGESSLQVISKDLSKAFEGKKDNAPGVGPQDVYKSPVLQKAHSIKDLSAAFLLTASSTDQTTIGRLGGKIKLATFVTGVMTPQENNFYQSQQLFGMCGGIKGVYDLELLMDKGINTKVPGSIESSKYGEIPNWPGERNFGKGQQYFFALHCELGLLIFAIAIGNIGMFISKRRKPA
jgi:hypothetical protein